MSTIAEELRLDCARIRPGAILWAGRLVEAATLDPGFRALAVFRFQDLCHNRGWRRCASILRGLNLALHGLDLVPGCRIGAGCRISHTTGIVIGQGVVIGKQCTLLQNCTIGETLSGSLHEYPVIGDRVTIAAGSVIVGKVVLGDDVLIAANAFVNQDLPPSAIAAGVPARIVGFRDRVY